MSRRVFSCDTLVARDPSGAPRTVFGKNSDRPALEAQPLELVPAATHGSGSYVRCQYLTIPQARRTHTVLGSRPWWLWGFEHGVNAAGVAIGNEAIYTKDEVPDGGLLGMDLVRLGLERGGSAREALATVIELLERYGQGGSGIYRGGTAGGYHNSYIIADAREAYVLETSARHWVYRQVETGAAIGNLVTIEDDWDDASDGIDAYARERGWWWGPPGRRLDFRAAFEDVSLRGQTQDRYAASCRYLATHDSPASLRGVMRHLRDHFESGTVHDPDPSRPRSICVHPGRSAGATAASVVVELTPDDLPPVAWCSMSTPCTGVFLPVEVGQSLPASLTIGGDAQEDQSLWWSMRRLAELVELDPRSLTPPVQAVWGPWEQELLAATTADASSAARELPGRVEELLDRRAVLAETLAETATAGSLLTAS
jgi:dipeptidase